MPKAAKKDAKIEDKVTPKVTPEGEDKPNTRKGPRNYTSPQQDKLLDGWSVGQECELDMLNGKPWVPVLFVKVNGTMMVTVTLEDGTPTRVGRKFIRLRTKP